VKRVFLLVMVATLLLLPSAAASAGGALTVSNPHQSGGGITFDFQDYAQTLSYSSARLAVWIGQDNPSFQTMADWGATFSSGPTDTVDSFNTPVRIGTIYVPGVLSDNCNKPGNLKVYFKLRDVTRPSRTTTKAYVWVVCPKN
jgi:hypothetical protein